MKCNLNNQYGKKSLRHRSWIERKIYSFLCQIKFMKYISMLSEYYIKESIQIQVREQHG